MRITLLILCLLTGPVTLAGCVDCTPESVPATVDVGFDAEEVRTLPVLTSGGTRLEAAGSLDVPGDTLADAGELPDSHGWLDFRVNVSHDVPDVDVEGLRLNVRVGDQRLPVKVLNVEGGSGWERRDADGTWDGRMASGAVSRVWWSVDRDQAPALSALVLDEGAPYAATLEFTWSHSSCLYEVAPQHARAFLDDFVQATANARTFERDGDPRFEVLDEGVGFQVDLRVRSGLDVTIDSVSAEAVYLAAGAAGGMGVVTFPAADWTVDGERKARVTPADALRVMSAEPAAANASYAASGALLPPGLDADGGLYALLVDVAYTPEDPTPGVERDRLAYVIER